MPPILEPTFVFELQAPPDAIAGGRINEPGLMFAGSPRMLYVAEPVWNATWGRWFSWHSPTIAASVFLATLLVAVWWMRRVVKRPRQAGRMYCRVCNHQLAKPQLKLNEKKRAVWADAESKCPECGVRHKRGPVRGRLRFTRMLPVLLISPVVLFVCGLVMLATLRFHQRVVGGGTWPVVGMAKLFGAWALERRGIGMDWQSTRLWRIDPRTGAKEEIGPIESWSMSYREFITPDGRFVVAPVETGRKMLVIDLASGRRSEYSQVRESRPYFSMERFAVDGGRAFLERATHRDSSVLHELVAFEPATGKLESIASVELPPDDRKAGTYSTKNFEFRETPEGIRWLHETTVRNSTGRREITTLRWEADGKKMQREEDSASGGLRFELSEDAKACIVADIFARSTRAFDLKTGDGLAIVPPVGERQERDRPGPRMLGFSNNGVMEVMSLKGERRAVGQLRVSVQVSPLVGSSDGRFAAGWKERDVAPSWIGAMLGVPPMKAPNVLVWDFEKLLDVETEEAIGAKVKHSLP